jgi:ferredoxin-NADP reductase
MNYLSMVSERRETVYTSGMFNSRLLKREEVAEGTIALTFARPEGFVFRAGQTIDLYIPNMSPTDSLGNSRTFSLASAPEDTDLMITIRIRQSAFKQAAKNLLPGAELSIDGPFGSFHLHNDTSRAAVFLAGGIGITPFRSIVRHAAQAGLPHRMILFYSNRRPQDAAFLTELTELAAAHPNLTFVPTMTSDSFLPGWEGLRGRINGEMIRKYVPDIPGSTYYVAGPFKFNLTMRDLLNEIGADDDFIKTDEFAGY